MLLSSWLYVVQYNTLFSFSPLLFLLFLEKEKEKLGYVDGGTWSLGEKIVMSCKGKVGCKWGGKVICLGVNGWQSKPQLIELMALKDPHYTNFSFLFSPPPFLYSSSSFSLSLLFFFLSNFIFLPSLWCLHKLKELKIWFVICLYM